MRSVINQISIGTSTVFTGLSAGFFATYCYSVTRALAVVDDSTYVQTFQAINATIRSPEFGVIFFGSAVALLVSLVLYRNVPRVRLLLGGALVAYLGLFAITFGFHVPMNNELATASTQTMALATEAREAFEIPWNRMHTVRTVGVLVAFVLTVAASVISRRDVV